jgi:antitoxin component YwqK of YwqJK toxin-antitoxin module
MSREFSNLDYNPSKRETINTSYYTNKKSLNRLPDDILNKIVNISNYEDSKNINNLDRDFNSRYPKSYLQTISSFVKPIEPHGTIRTYYDVNKTKIKEIIEYRNGVKHGEYLKYHKLENGDTRINLKVITNYNKDKLEGRYFEYFKNGQLFEDSFYKNGKKEGTSTHYWQNGNFTVTNYTQGKMNGEEIRYNKNGIILNRELYRNGKEVF